MKKSEISEKSEIYSMNRYNWVKTLIFFIQNCVRANSVYKQIHTHTCIPIIYVKVF